jgi:hypothetical protein
MTESTLSHAERVGVRGVLTIGEARPVFNFRLYNPSPYPSGRATVFPVKRFAMAFGLGGWR